MKDDDIMHQRHRIIASEDKARISSIKEIGRAFVNSCNTFSHHAPRESALAKTKMEEAVMWAIKGIAK